MRHPDGGPAATPDSASLTRYVCMHCKAEVWWALPQPEDPCWECGKPIAKKEETQ